jgi:hypothetical protein
MDIPFNALPEARQREIGELILRFSKGEGMHASAIAGLHCIRLSAPHAPLPTVYRPSFCVIVQGAKQVLLEDEVYRYAPSQFLAVSVDLPLVGQVLEASAEAPYLCVAIDIDARQIAELIEQVGPIGQAPRDTPRGLFVGELDEATQDTVLRLARLLATPHEIPVLAPLLMRPLRCMHRADGHGRQPHAQDRAGHPAHPQPARRADPHRGARLTGAHEPLGLA